MEMFNDSERVAITQIQSANFFSNYTEKFRSDIIGSLVAAGLFKIQGDTMVLMSSGIFKSNLIEVFFTSSDYSSIWDQQRREELCHTREEVTNAVINTVIKNNNNGLTFDELFNLVKSRIQVFELDQTVFIKSVEYMCKSDYIKCDESGKYMKLFY
jgi:hypothetical protein